MKPVLHHPAHPGVSRPDVSAPVTPTQPSQAAIAFENPAQSLSQTGLVHHLQERVGGNPLLEARAAEAPKKPRSGRGRTKALKKTVWKTIEAQMSRKGVSVGFRAALDLVKVERNKPRTEAQIDELAPKVVDLMRESMKGTRAAKPDEQFDLLRRSGLDRALAKALLDGKLTLQLERGEIARLRDQLTSFGATPTWQAILALHDAFQRFYYVGGKTKEFEYPELHNRARDEMLGYASAVYR